MRIYHNIDVGYGSYGSMFTPGSFKPGTVIGNYCSFSSSVFQYNANHPYSKFTTHPILYHEDYTGSKSEELKRVNLIIGHDVWIGHGVVILPGCSNIGNGAVIGAGSIVTKDVPAYSIVVGNPAKVIRMRFKEEIIEKLEVTQWWLWDKETLIKNIDKLERIVRGED
ncbi:MAG: CatB-related O-acetyltransferase [Clostridia bacterium]|nr:CatB-related O-acetyltransferase [Clostridia bacterium]